jgi:N6-L-threonylcarbamoyladenine synthase
MRLWKSTKWPVHLVKPTRTFPSCRSLLTLAIETSCDDTCVAVLEKDEQGVATLHFNRKVTSDNRLFGGIHPILSHQSHQAKLSPLIASALQALPRAKTGEQDPKKILPIHDDGESVVFRKKPDFIAVTRGPGMRSSLLTGIDTAKGLAVAWQIPVLGLNHMLAHALTPRLCDSLAAKEEGQSSPCAEKRRVTFPFLSLLVSGGHTMLLYSRSLCDHQCLSQTIDLAIGDLLDKCARVILPKELLTSASDVMYGALLEQFAFSGDLQTSKTQPSTSENAYAYEAPINTKESNRTRSTPYDWSLPPPFCSETSDGSNRASMAYSFSALGSVVKDIMESNPTMDLPQRRCLARELQRVAFEHLVSRVHLALVGTPNLSKKVSREELQRCATLVLSGGVASNTFCQEVVRRGLEARCWSGNVEVPNSQFCTDNAAMVAWAGMEMWESGHRGGFDWGSVRRWSLDPGDADGGILGVKAWDYEMQVLRRDGDKRVRG